MRRKNNYLDYLERVMIGEITEKSYFVKFLFLSITLVYVCVCDHRNKFEGVFNGKKRIFKEVMRLLKVVILFSLFYFNFLRFVISLIFLNVLSTVYFKLLTYCVSSFE